MDKENRERKIEELQQWIDDALLAGDARAIIEQVEKLGWTLITPQPAGEKSRTEISDNIDEYKSLSYPVFYHIIDLFNRFKLWREQKRDAKYWESQKEKP